MTKPLKVLTLTVRADIGGGPEHLYQLIGALGNEVDVIVACPDDRPYDARYRALDNVSQVRTIPHRAFQLRPMRRLARLARDEDVQLIHSHGKGAGLYGRLIAAITGLPCVHTFHGVHVGEYGAVKKGLYLGLERVLGHFTAMAIAVSGGEAALIREARLLPEAKLKIIENGVAVPRVLNHTPQGDVLQVVAVNRYDTQKNPELLLEIAALLKAKNAPVFITVLGRGDALESFRARVRANELDSHIMLAGPTDNPRERIRQAQVFLSTSRWEGMPLAVLEAMSEGLAIVATDVVGNHDVVENEVCGLLYPTENAAAATAHLIGLAANPARCAKLGQGGHTRSLTHYSMARMGQETLALYKAILPFGKGGRT